METLSKAQELYTGSALTSCSTMQKRLENREKGRYTRPGASKDPTMKSGTWRIYTIQGRRIILRSKQPANWPMRRRESGTEDVKYVHILSCPGTWNLHAPNSHCINFGPRSTFGRRRTSTHAAHCLELDSLPFDRLQIVDLSARPDN
jgi:hypothetical protein